MPRIRSITNLPDTHNLQTRVVSFPDKKKLIKR